MIHLNFEFSKDPNYLGAREINQNSITMGPKGIIFIEKEHFPYPEIKIKIQENKLIFSVSSGEHYIQHNGKRSRLPIVTNIGDKIEFKNFRISIINFKKIKYTSYRNFTNQALENTQKNPRLMNLISKLTNLLD